MITGAMKRAHDQGSTGTKVPTNEAAEEAESHGRAKNVIEGPSLATAEGKSARGRDPGRWCRTTVI